MRGHERQHGQDRAIGGFLFTDVIRKRLDEAPHVRLESPLIGKISILYGRSRVAGDPAATVFCRVESPNGRVHEEVISAGNRKNAINSMGVGISRLVWEYEARQRQLRRGVMQQSQENSQLRKPQGFVQRGYVIYEKDPEVQRMRETGKVPIGCVILNQKLFGLN